LTAPFNVTSNMTLFVDKDAKILGSTQAVRTVSQMSCSFVTPLLTLACPLSGGLPYSSTIAIVWSKQSAWEA